MAINLEPEEPMESESEVVDEGSSEEVDSEESDYESDNESDNKSELTHAAMEKSKDAVGVGYGREKHILITSDSSTEKWVLNMGKRCFEAGEGIEGEIEWKKMKMMDCKLKLRMLKVRAAQTKLVLNYMKAGNH